MGPALGSEREEPRSGARSFRTRRKTVMGAGVAASPHCLEAFNSRLAALMSALERFGPPSEQAPAAPWLPDQERKAPGGSPVADPKTRRETFRRSPPVPAIASACASALPAGSGTLTRPFPRRRLRRAALPLASGRVSRGKPSLPLGIGLTSEKPLPVPPRSCRASAEVPRPHRPWLAPGCRCRGGFVSRPALHVPPRGTFRSGCD
jgi:hypothetical protein